MLKLILYNQVCVHFDLRISAFTTIEMPFKGIGVGGKHPFLVFDLILYSFY